MRGSGPRIQGWLGGHCARRSQGPHYGWNTALWETSVTKRKSWLRAVRPAIDLDITDVEVYGSKKEMVSYNYGSASGAGSWGGPGQRRVPFGSARATLIGAGVSAAIRTCSLAATWTCPDSVRVVRASAHRSGDA